MKPNRIHSRKTKLVRLLGLCCAAGLFAPGIVCGQSANDGFEPNPDGPVQVIAVDTQGRVIIGGAFTTVDGASRGNLARLHGDGTVDEAFNMPANDGVSALAVQADGKILLGGEFSILGGQPRSSLARLHADGSLDPTFDPGANDEVYCLLLQADGKILVGGGFTTLGGQPRSRLGRLNANGSLDTGFNPGASDGVASFALQPDGKILVGGIFTTLGGQPRSNLGRLNSDGSLDATFNPGTDGVVSSLAVQTDGKILVGGGFATLGGQPRERLGRLHPNGSLDTGFNPGANEQVFRLAIQTDGKILVGGQFTILGGQPREHVGRLNPDGSLEIVFNPGANNWVSSFALQTGGRILVGGFFTTLGGQPRSHLGRLNADGSVYACTNAPAGLVGWWKAETNAFDTLGNHNGSSQGGLGFGPGKVGQAFNFTAAGQEVRVAASPSINVGTGGGYTTEGWIHPLNVTTQNPIFEWNDGVTAGAHLWIAVSGAGFGGPGSLYASLIAGNTDTTVATGPGAISAGVWQHVAFTYDRASGMGRLYLNGTEVASRALGNITAQTALPLRIGRRPNFGAETFAGKIDELSLYNRALSSAELQAIYNADSAGKCPTLPNLSSGQVAWGDYDNDGRLDLLLTGNSNGDISQLWHNDGNGSFTQLPVPGLPGVVFSSVAWGDYDNDGRLDFLLTGRSSLAGPVSQLWHNSGSGTFTQVPVSGLPGVDYSSVAWGDYDNDGRLDFLLTGNTNNIVYKPVSQLWHNNGNGDFTQRPVPGLPDVDGSSVAWGDYDNDGRLDFLLTGNSAAGYISQLWHININGTFTQIPVSGLPGVDLGSVAWGDYDNDGRLDFLLTGQSSTGVVSQLWHNNSNGTFSNVTSVAAPGLPGVKTSSVAWGDYDNDGWLDFLLTGSTGPSRISQLWHNNGNGTFSNTTSVAAPGLPGVERSSVAWGDYDNDGRVDFLLTGYNGTDLVSRLWHNQVVTTNPPPGGNTSPGPPGGLTMVITNDDVVLNWSAASDAETPAASLTYNLRMGTTPGGSDIVSPNAAPNGFRLLPAMGNRQQTRSAKIHFPLNQALYWTVQAVDSAFAGSAFAPEQNLKISIGPAAVPAVVPGDLNGDGVVDQSELNGVLTSYWPSSPWLQMNDPAKLPDGLFQFALTNASAWLFSVEVTTNFITWGPLGPAYPVYQFHDPASTNSPMRYYRLRWP